MRVRHTKGMTFSICSINLLWNFLKLSAFFLQLSSDWTGHRWPKTSRTLCASVFCSAKTITMVLLCTGSWVFMERGFNCTLPASPDQVSTVPPLNLPQAQLPGKAFMIKCETRAVLPRESWRRGCWLRTTTVWNFFAVCHTQRKMKADVESRERKGEKQSSKTRGLLGNRYCTNKSKAIFVKEYMAYTGQAAKWGFNYTNISHKA